MKGSIVQLQEGERKVRNQMFNEFRVINAFEGNQVYKLRIKYRIAKFSNMWT